MVMSKNTVVERRQDIVTASLDGDAVMMSIENGKYYGMDEIASAIWKNMEHPICVEQLIHVLIDEFNVSEEQCQKDVIVFLEKLYKENLIKVN